MTTKMKPARSRKPRATAEAEPIAEIIVRRGALRRFDALKRKTADLPVVVSWDRRLEERRSAATPTDGNRRQSDRRSTKPPFTWDLSDFVVVSPRGTTEGTSPRGTAQQKPAAAKPKRKKRA